MNRSVYLFIHLFICYFNLNKFLTTLQEKQSVRRHLVLSNQEQINGWFRFMYSFNCQGTRPGDNEVTF